MKKVKLIVLFIIINFGCLYIGSWLINRGPQDFWYKSLQKAPWTPPGWVFGTAWSIIMICFSIYLADLFSKTTHINAKIAYAIQILLNVSWNFVFFNQHQILLGLIVLLALNVVLCYFFFSLKKDVEKSRFLLIPYMVWMCIANSLNMYILIHN